jgi:hypothetical protein
MSKFIRLHIFVGIALFLSTIVFQYSEYQSARTDENIENKDRISTKPIALLTLTPMEKLWLSAHKTIRVAGPKSFPPFHYYDSDNILKGMASGYLMWVLGVSCIAVRKPA